MSMSPRLRKVALTAHVTVSLAWIGSVTAFLALVVTAITGGDDRLRAGRIAMDTIGWVAIVPLALASLLTGIVMALGTKRGLFRHYWVLISLFLTALATTILVLNMRTVSGFAALAIRAESASAEALRSGLRRKLLHAGVGLLVLLVIDVLNVYKPRGMTPYGRRMELRSSPDADTTKDAGGAGWRWQSVSVIVVLALILVRLGVHLSGGGMGGLHRH